ncbi:MAG: RagB/SusD family nutrient uptake outer membrane protein [Candidatus Pseudobacter hemicellulosilyticus]|uniref:RagB/SusD family nutrient uptake outer membrane protein n=1 Tax=Candidatus Pseudobacter hemicellulosilyticus TaxID=3121375 RepID=A0AAJ5WRH3_9BACT|nr:MAG: RagB/SusD family nutrient uptake outer membrane protein [Pseudobacter sp.]
MSWTLPPLNNEYGRITKGITKAFKEKALLLAASPLFNGNTDLSSLKNGDGTQLVNQSFDANKWKLAADAAKAFIDEFVPTTYKLYIDPTVTTDTFKLGYLSCRNVMIKVWNEEWIFGRTLSSSNGSDNSQYDKRPKHVGFTTDVQGGGALGATQTIVDAYFMKNGLPITDPASGYVSTAGYTSYQAPFDVQARSTYNQWINREPRFYVGITYNNSYWLYQTTNTSQVITKMEFSGNSGRTQSTSDVSPTGYIVRKGENTANAGLTAGVQIRLADIYLDYAEALNEYDPGNSDILKYVNLIRQRAGIAQYGDLEGQIPLSNTQSAVRDAIRRERQIELAFENHRYFDCHRWKTAMTTDNAPVYGMNMYANGDAFYVRTLIKARIFQQRDYFWPIPNDEVLKNELMVQNPGW